MKVARPSGAWVLLRDPMSVTRRDRKRILMALDDVEGRYARVYAEADPVLALAVLEWSFDRPIPSVSIDSLDELSPADDDALTAAAKEFEEAVFPSFDVDEDEDPKEDPPPGS